VGSVAPLGMSGASLTLCRLDDEVEEPLAAPASTPVRVFRATREPSAPGPAGPRPPAPCAPSGTTRTAHRGGRCGCGARGPAVDSL
jgi:hypothetical protein